MKKPSQALYTRRSRQDQRQSAPLDDLFIRPRQPRWMVEEITVEQLKFTVPPRRPEDDRLDAAYRAGMQAALDAAAAQDAERDEFAGDSTMERNPNEHPEQAFRRGLQQGAAEVYHALERAKVLPDQLRKRLCDYVYGALWKFRHAKRRPLSRHIVKDRPPRLEIKAEAVR